MLSDIEIAQAAKMQPITEILISGLMVILF